MMRSRIRPRGRSETARRCPTKSINPGGARQRADFGRGEHVIELEGYVDPGELADRIRTIIRAPSYRPPVLPAAALELVRLSNQPNVNFKEVQAILERDALITGRVLQVAQSPLYNTGGGQLTLQQALTRLGLTTLTQIFLETSMNMRVFRAPGYDAPMNIVRRHATATAHFARAVCRHAAFGEEYAFLCGLLHDCGIAVALLVAGDVKRGEKPPPVEDVMPAVLEIHEEIGGLLCKMWKLPPDVELVVGHHHSCTVDGQVHPLTAAIAVAEGLAAQAGYGLDGDTQPDLPQVAVSALRITEKTMAVIRTDATAALQRIA